MRYFALSIVVFFLFGCPGQPKKYYSNKTKGQWSGELKITDKRNKRSDTIDFEAIADRRWGERVQLTALMGSLVGAVVVRSKSVRILVVDGKKFYKGPLSASVLKPLLGVRVDPRLLRSVLYDDLPAEKDWDCQLDGNDLPKYCRNSRSAHEIYWRDRDGESKTVEIKLDQFKLRFSITSFDPSVELQSRQFKLTPPRGYKVYKIRPKPRE